MPEDIDNLACDLYETYCAAVGGKAFNGDNLPTWEQFKSDPKKKVQADAWRKVAAYAQSLIDIPNI